MEHQVGEVVHRLVLGSGSSMLLVETAIRATLLYLILNVAMRLIGRKLVSQMTSVDMATVATMGAAIGGPMHSGDVGILASVLVLGTAIGVYRLMGTLRSRSRYLRNIMSNEPLTLVRNARLVLDNLGTSGIARSQLFSLLRSMGVEHLGQVERVYLECTGAFAVFFAASPAPGLSILPQSDIEVRARQAADSDRFACSACGHLAVRQDRPCSQCAGTAWEQAVQARTASSPQRAIDLGRTGGIRCHEQQTAIVTAAASHGG